MDEWNVSVAGQKMFEECLVKNYTLLGLIAGNVGELYEMTCELVKRKERETQLEGILQNVETDWEMMGFRVVNERVMETFSNLTTLIDKLAQYEMQFSTISSSKINGMLQDRIDQNKKMINYCTNFLNTLKKVQ